MPSALALFPKNDLSTGRHKVKSGGRGVMVPRPLEAGVKESTPVLGWKEAAQKSFFLFAMEEFPIDGRFAINHIGYVAASAKELHYFFPVACQLRPS